MSFWSKLAGSLLYTRTELEEISNKIPPICIEFIKSRLILSEAVVKRGIEDPLDDIGGLKQMMQLFTIIGRRNYKTTVQELVSQFDEKMNTLIQPGISNIVSFYI